MQPKYSSVPFFAVILCVSLTACGTSKQIAAPQVTTPNKPAEPTTNNTAVFIGDSITYLWGNQTPFADHANWIDKGISGQGSQQIAMRFQKDVIDLKPSVVHIIAGTNDVQAGWSLCPTPSFDAATPSTPPGPATLNYPGDTCANMTYMVETAKRNGIKVVIGTIPPWGCASDPSCGFAGGDTSSDRLKRIDQLNAWLKIFSVQEGVTLVDYHAALADGLHYATGLTIDGVHPSAAGYSVMEPLMEAHVH